MKIAKAEKLVKRFLKDYELEDYKVTFSDRMTVVFGSCYLKRKELRFSRKLTELNSRKVFKNIVLHEIAHALTKQGHTGLWRMTARYIGDDGKRCYGSEVITG